jgi:hypothetical protein
LGLIGHNGAGNQAAGQLLGRLPKAARRVRRRGKARINTTLLKMLNGLLSPPRQIGKLRGRLLKAARRVNRDLGEVKKDCRKAAPKEEQDWEICESKERE